MSKTKWRKRTFDSRLSFGQISKLLGLSPKQRIIMRRFIQDRLKKEVDIQD